MTEREILNALKNRRNGTYISIKKQKQLPNDVVQISNIVARIGCSYGNISSVKSRLNGLKPQNLPWGNWKPGYENLIIEHKGNNYLRVTNDYCDRNTSTYMLNGKEISKQEAEKICGTNAIKSKKSDVYNIKFDNIISIK